jgi:hypothetical protein
MTQGIGLSGVPAAVTSGSLGSDGIIIVTASQRHGRVQVPYSRRHPACKAKGGGGPIAVPELVLNLFAALGLAFAITAIATFVAESESSRGLVAGSFLFGTALFYATLVLAYLPKSPTFALGASGLILGMLFSAARIITRRIENP